MRLFRQLAAIAAASLGYVAMSLSVGAADFTVLYNFEGRPGGSNPMAGLTADGAGTVYGTACGEALPTCAQTTCPSRCGVVFTLSGGQADVLHVFRGLNGGLPEGAVLLDGNGIEGTTNNGGAHNGGAVYRLSGGTETVLYSFCSLRHCKDGVEPVGTLIADAGGNLYGVTEAGGDASQNCVSSGCGVVFRVAHNGGRERVLHSFCSEPNCTDGAFPSAGLIADGAGNMYGTTASGGAQNEGTVYRVAHDGTYSVIHSFCSLPQCADGDNPQTRLTLGTDGMLYGTAGAVVFKMTTGGGETVIYRFKRKNDGQGPNSALTIDKKGNLYGTTSDDTFGRNACAEFGERDCGTVFKITPDGRETILYVFPNGAGGAFPVGDLLLINGLLYGVTEFGGDEACGFDGCGLVYSLTR